MNFERIPGVAEKAARSVSEVYGKVSSVPDLVIYLEILGYNDALVSKYGFASVLDFARYIFDYVDYFRADSTSENGAFPETQIKSIYIRIFEALALAFPIVAMLGPTHGRGNFSVDGEDLSDIDYYCLSFRRFSGNFSH